MGVKETDEELALFLEVQRRDKEKEKYNLLFHNNTDDIDVSLEPDNGNHLVSEAVSSMPQKKTGVDDFLNLQSEMTDYDWLLTPPGTPLFPSLENESRKTVISQIGSNVCPTALKSRLANVKIDPTSKNNLATKHPTPTFPGSINSMTANIKRSTSVTRPSSTGRAASLTRPSSAGRAASLTRPSSTGRAASLTRPSSAGRAASLTRPSSTGRATSFTRPSSIGRAASLTRPSSTGRPASITGPLSTGKQASILSAMPTGRATLPGTTKTSRSSSPTSRPTLPSMKSAAPQVRSSTPARAIVRSSTPTARSSFPTSKPTLRAVTPNRQPATRSSSSTVSVQQTSSSSVTKLVSTMPKNSAQSKGNFPSVKVEPSKPSVLPGFSLDTPPNLRKSLPERPLSASRGRPECPDVRTSPIGIGPSGRTRQQSCSPSRGRNSNANANKRSSMSTKSKAYSSGSDDVNPVLIGTQMVERVVNMRKLGPLKRDDNSAGKSASSADSLGFGRTLSKTSLDMAIRHVDIRRSKSGTSLRPLMKGIPASSMYSVRSGSTKSRESSMPGSPLATCSNTSSEPSVNNLSNYFSAMDDNDLKGEKVNTSPIN